MCKIFISYGCYVKNEFQIPEREIRIVKRHEQPLSIAARELERLILRQEGENR